MLLRPRHRAATTGDRTCCNRRMVMLLPAHCLLVLETMHTHTQHLVLEMMRAHTTRCTATSTAGNHQGLSRKTSRCGMLQPRPRQARTSGHLCWNHHRRLLERSNLVLQPEASDLEPERRRAAIDGGRCWTISAASCNLRELMLESAIGGAVTLADHATTWTPVIQDNLDDGAATGRRDAGIDVFCTRTCCVTTEGVTKL